MRPLTVPYRLLVLLLYGNQTFLSRYGTQISAPNLPVAKAVCCTRVGRLKEHLHWLEEMGLLKDVRCHKHMFTCKLTCPRGMEWNMGEVENV